MSSPANLLLIITVLVFSVMYVPQPFGTHFDSDAGRRCGRGGSAGLDYARAHGDRSSDLWGCAA